MENNGGLITREKLNEFIERASQPVCPPFLPLTDARLEKIADRWAYVFPIDPDKPVKIVFEQEIVEEEELINELYKKLKEISDGNKESD